MAHVEHCDPIESRHADSSRPSRQTEDPVLALRGLGKEIWEDEGADEYVRGQRADWR